MTDRRYTDEEAAEIFGRAASADDAPTRALARAEGMTLAELQAAGREAGIAPDRIAEAARSLAVAGERGTRRLLGVTIGVSRTVDLERRLSDEEWERLVVVLRETFDARGALRAHGSLREWTNGNLQALLEPTETGHRLRLRTTHGTARAMMAGGLAMMGLAGAVGIASFATIGTAGADGGFGIATIAMIGAASFGAGILRLTGWAKRRRAQMDEIAGKLAP